MISYHLLLFSLLIILSISLLVRTTGDLPRTTPRLQSASYYEHKFLQWMTKYTKSFSHMNEFFHRLNIFSINDDMITLHNQKNKGYTLNHNEYSDLTWEEFRMMYKGYTTLPPAFRKTRPLKIKQEETVTNGDDTIKNNRPAAVDWVTNGAVTHVKNQGRCGSCWAFSTTGAIEGSIFVQEHQLYNFSEQQLVDCDHNGDMGCHGGLMDHAFQWLEQNHHGLCTEDAYEYKGVQGTCRKCNAKAHVVDYHDVTPDNEDALAEAVAKQPVSIAIEADQPEFQFYSHGVFNGTCGDKLDHGVLLVGYGVDNGLKFWKIKNSWGPSWGEGGYIRVARDIEHKSGKCGLASVPSYPIAKLVKTEESENLITKEKPLLLQIAEKETPVVVSSASITQCGDKDKALANFESLDINPKTPSRGNPIKFYGSGDLKQSFSNATFRLVVKLSGFTVFKTQGSMCGESHVPLPLGLGHLDFHGFSCPMQSKTFTNIGADVNLPFLSPSGTYEIELKSQTDDKDIFCVNVALGLSSAAQSPTIYKEITM